MKSFRKCSVSFGCKLCDHALLHIAVVILIIRDHALTALSAIKLDFLSKK
jgi:hypothetical protein